MNRGKDEGCDGQWTHLAPSPSALILAKIMTVLTSALKIAFAELSSDR